MRNAELFRHIEHVLGGKLAPEIQAIDVVRQAADWVSGSHAWKFLERPLHLSLRGVIDLTGAAYAHTGRLLTKPSAFTDYDYVAGDRFEPSGGTGVEAFPVQIHSKISGTALQLAGEGLGAAADLSGDVSGRLPNDSIGLPTDFMALVGANPIWATDSIVRGIRLTTHEMLTQRRTSNITVDASWYFIAAFSELINQATGSSEPVLELHPPASAGRLNAFQCYYRARIAIDDSSETAVVPIPASRPLIEQVLIRAVRAVAMGYEEGEEANAISMDDRLDRLLQSSLWLAAKRQDGLAQPTTGPMRGGVGQGWAGRIRRLLATEVEGPT